MKSPVLVRILVAVAVTAAPPLTAEACGADATETLKSARGRLDNRDFDGALRLFDTLSKEQKRQPDAAVVGATIFLGQALRDDNGFSDSIRHQTLLARLVVDTQGFMEAKSNNDFLIKAKQLGDAYASSNRVDVNDLVSKLSSVYEATCKADRVLEAATSNDGARPPMPAAGMVLHLWSKLLRFVVAKQSPSIIDQLRVSQLVSVESLRVAEAKLPDARMVAAEELALAQRLAEAARSAAQSTDTRYVTAVAEVLSFYCAVTGRFNSGAMLRSLHKQTTLPKEGSPSPVVPLPKPVPLREDVAGGIRQEASSASIRSNPEYLLLWLYARAVSVDTGRREPAAHYGYICTLYRLNEAEVEPHLRKWLEAHPNDGIFRAELARCLLRVREKPKETLQELERATRSPGWGRPVYRTLPEPLQQLWLDSRYVRDYGSSFILDFHPLFQFIDAQAAQLRIAGQSNLTLLPIRIRLAERLLGGNLVQDVKKGAQEAQRSLSILRSKGGSDEVQAQADVYERRVAVAAQRVANLPHGLVISEKGVQVMREIRGRNEVVNSGMRIVITAEGSFFAF